MAKTSTYPAECPAFEYGGEVYAGRPYLGKQNGLVIGPGITLVTDTEYCGPDFPAVFPEEHCGKLKPLTKAAKELLKWSRQS